MRGVISLMAKKIYKTWVLVATVCDKFANLTLVTHELSTVAYALFDNNVQVTHWAIKNTKPILNVVLYEILNITQCGTNGVF